MLQKKATVFGVYVHKKQSFEKLLLETGIPLLCVVTNETSHSLEHFISL